MPTVKLTADLSEPMVRIVAEDVDGPGRDVFLTDIPSELTFALHRAHHAMRRVAQDLGGRLDLDRECPPGTRYVLGVD